MFDNNFTIATKSNETDAQVMSVIIGRAIRRLEYYDLIDTLDSSGRELMFNLKCSEELIREACCLNSFIEGIGEDQFESIVTSLSSMGWGTEDAFLMAYLANWADHFETADDEDEAEDNDAFDLPELRKYVLR